MTEVELLMKALDEAHWELGEGFQGLPDEDVWRRPAPSLLSVGELASHIAFWEAQSFLGEGFESPLTTKAAHYYTTSIDRPLVLNLTAVEVLEEVKRVHEACKAALSSVPHSMEDPSPHREGWTIGYTLRYQAFHVAYHAGQIYSVRHLLGHQTTDN